MDEHIEKTRLSSDLRYRFDYLSKFLNFTINDVKILNALVPIVGPLVPVIVDTVYRKLFSYDITKEHFLVRDEENKNMGPNVSNDLRLQSNHMILRKDMLSSYLKRVLSQTEWDEAFLQYLFHIGQLHTGQSGSRTIHVDYIHINALLGYLEHLLLDILWKAENIESTKKFQTIITINKFFWIQNDFFIMHLMNTQNGASSTSLTPVQGETKEGSKKSCCPCLPN